MVMRTKAKTGAVISFAMYARHRGCSAAAVSKAHATGRLLRSIIEVNGKDMISSAAEADAEWAESTRFKSDATDEASSGPSSPLRSSSTC